jgi:hypothetical protein
MHRRGYTRYVAQGGDAGASVTDAMGRQAPEGLASVQPAALTAARTRPDGDHLVHDHVNGRRKSRGWVSTAAVSVNLGGGGQGMSSRPFAEATQARIDDDVARLLREAEQAAVELIRAHRPELRQLVDLLVEQETVDGSAVYRLIGQPVPGHRPEQLTIAPTARAAAGPVSRNGSGASGSQP